MIWTLWLIFLMVTGDPEYVHAEADDASSCIEMGKMAKEAMEDENNGVVWVCVGPNGEVITDEGGEEPLNNPEGE